MPPAEKKKLFGWYSAKAARRFGSCFYSTPDGREVEVTGISANVDGSDYNFDDKVPVGPVAHWIRDGRQGTEQAYL